MKNKQTKKHLMWDAHQHVVTTEIMLNHVKNNKNYYLKDQNFENIIDLLIKISQGADQKLEQVRNKTAYIK